MSNLQNLINKLLDDAKKEASNILEQAELKKENMIKQKKDEANKRVANLIEQAKREAKQVETQAISSATINARNERLKAKGEIIDKVFELIMDKLLNLDDESYIKFLQNRLNGIELKGTETLIVPKSKQHIAKELALPINIDESKTVQSGFQVVDDRLTLNYTFTSLLDYYEDELQLMIARLLFKE